MLRIASEHAPPSQEAERAAKARGDPKPPKSAPPKKVEREAPANCPSTSAQEQQKSIEQITEKAAALSVETATRCLFE